MYLAESRLMTIGQVSIYIPLYERTRSVISPTRSYVKVFLDIIWDMLNPGQGKIHGRPKIQIEMRTLLVYYQYYKHTQ